MRPTSSLRFGLLRFLYKLIDLMQSVIAEVDEVLARDSNVTVDNLKKVEDSILETGVVGQGSRRMRVITM